MHSDAMRHDLLVYDSDEQYMEQMVPFFEAGLERGNALVAVPARATAPLLREALGPASEQVRFHICEDWYTRPEAALASYDAAVRACLRDGATGVCVVAEVPFCSSQYGWDSWIRYEAIFNAAFAGRPVSVTCTYDARAVPDRVVDAVRQAHPHLVSEDGRRENPDYKDPAEVLRRFEPRPEPLPDLHDLPVGGDPRALRAALLEELAHAGVARNQAEAMLLAIGEVMVNAARHGGGVRSLRVGGGRGTFACQVSDGGSGFEDPFAGYVPPGAPAASGAGLWVARQLTRRLDLAPSPEGGLRVTLWT
jgi:anti-sigma regulatory factor (Ser/Thr protein kinase)